MENLNDALKELNYPSGDLDLIIKKLTEAKADLSEFIEHSARIFDALDEYKSKMESEGLIGEDFYIHSSTFNNYKERIYKLQKAFPFS